MSTHIVWYDSSSHGRRRYISGHGPGPDGKPRWTYQRSRAKVMSEDAARVTVMWAKACGYHTMFVWGATRPLPKEKYPQVAKTAPAKATTKKPAAKKPAARARTKPASSTQPMTATGGSPDAEPSSSELGGGAPAAH